MKPSEEQKEKISKVTQYAPQNLSPIAVANAVQMWAWRSQTFKNRVLALENAYVPAIRSYEKYKERVICSLENWVYQELEDHLDLLY